MIRFFLLCAAFFGFSGVALGAFAAHGLKKQIAPASLAVFQTGVHYQMLHALALLLVAVLAMRLSDKWLKASGIFFILGILLFSGSLYTLTWVGLGPLGLITPVGGVSFLIGWLCLGITAWRYR